MDKFFRQSLRDLVRGIRNHKKDEVQYIHKALSDIKEELRSPNMAVKVQAIQKLTYLSMLGYDVSWACFNVVEVMSSSRFTDKRVGYLAASTLFSEDTDVVMLCTNLIKKDLCSSDPYDCGLAINCLSNICTTDLARDTSTDIVKLLSHSRPYIRKKAVLVLYKIFLKFPEALRPTYPRLVEKLDDVDQSVVSATVNVICELARKNPKNYQNLAPVLFRILKTSTNNWMLIKITKLFAALMPFEKRLPKKLAEPLMNIINSTSAMSLLYECIQACIIGLSHNATVMRLCISKLRLFVEDPDQNLKYLGLLALYNIMHVHPKAVTEHRDLVVWCLDDEDITIRLRALDLLAGMATRRNLNDLVEKLVEKLEHAEGEFRDELVAKIIGICSHNMYHNITDFEWYVTVLVELTHVEGCTHGDLIAQQLMDVCIRVKQIRTFAVRTMVALLKDPRLTVELPGGNSMKEVLYAAAYITGEYLQFTPIYVDIIEILLRSNSLNLPMHVQSIYMQTAMKIYTRALAKGLASQTDLGGGAPAAGTDAYSVLKNISDILEVRLPDFMSSTDIEVQERACTLKSLMDLYEQPDEHTRAFAAFLAQALDEQPLNPVASQAQKKVPIPRGLDLDRVINEVEEEEDELFSDWKFGPATSSMEGSIDDISYGSPGRKEIDPEILRKDAEQQKKRRQEDVFILAGSTASRSKPKSFQPEYQGELPPEQQLPEDIYPTSTPPSTPADASSLSHVLRRRKPSKHKERVQFEILNEEEMPEGATFSDSGDDEHEEEDNVFSSIDLSTKLRPDEALPEIQAYPMTTASAHAEPPRPDNEKGEKHKSRRHRSRKERGDEKRRRRRHDRHDRHDRRDRHERHERHERHDKQDKEKDSSANLIDLSPSASEKPAQKEQTEDSGRRHRSHGSSREHRGDRREREHERGERSHRHRDRRGRERDREHRRSDREESSRHGGGGGGGDSDKNIRVASNSSVSVEGQIKVKPTEPNMVACVFFVKNRRSRLSNVSFNIEEKSNLKILQKSDFPSKLSSSETVQERILFSIKDITKPECCKGELHYNSTSLPLSLTIPCSTFILPAKISKDEFANIIQSKSSSLAYCNATCNVSLSPQKLMAWLCSNIHVVPVDSFENTASLYGKSIQGHHVLLLVKHQTSSFRVDLKCTDSVLGASLLAEITTAYN